MSVGSWLRERTAPAATPATVPGPSFAYVAGWVLVMLLGVQAVTGAALAAFYAPTTTDAWASVAYIQDQMNAGWLIRGLHHHGASALVIVAGLHLAQTALYGAYKRPRELVWWLGIVLLLLVLAFAITGYVLRWDQAGYWANQVEGGERVESGLRPVARTARWARPPRRAGSPEPSAPVDGSAARIRHVERGHLPAGAGSTLIAGSRVSIRKKSAGPGQTA